MTSLNDVSGEPVRNPDDFRRDRTGTPYVSDPSGATIKDGSRPKWLKYGRPSNFGKQIEDTYNLVKWGERRIVLGLAFQGTDPGTGGHCVHGLLAADGSPADDWEAQADGIIAAAKDVARANEAAERGTHTHSLTEADDGGKSWLTLAEEGADLGIPRPAQEALVKAWRTLLQAYGLEVLAVETPVVHDGYRLAGTLDRIARLGRDLVFAIDGELVTIPAGTILVLDLKTGSLKTDAAGRIGYWHSYAVQVATYAGAVPYDTRTETRRAWDWDISQRWGLIAHLPVADALDGIATARLVAVNLERGNHAARLCMAAKEWQSSSDAFGMAHMDIEVVVPVTEQEAKPARTPYVPPLTARAPARPARPAAPAEGATVREYDVAALREAFNAHPNLLAIVGVTRACNAAGYPVSVTALPSVRRFDIAAGLMAWARLPWAELNDGDDDGHRLLRSVLRAVTADEACEMPGVDLGMVVGTLTVEQANRFAGAMHALLPEPGTAVADAA